MFIKRWALIEGLPTFIAFKGLLFYVCSWRLVREEVLQMAFTTLELSAIYFLLTYLLTEQYVTEGCVILTALIRLLASRNCLMFNNVCPLTKAFPNQSHLLGFSLIWILWCLIRGEVWLKAYLLSWHRQTFPLVCTVWCWVKIEVFQPKVFPHTLHMTHRISLQCVSCEYCVYSNWKPSYSHWIYTAFFPAWLFWCLIRDAVWAKALPHSLHL